MERAIVTAALLISLLRGLLSSGKSFCDARQSSVYRCYVWISGVKPY
jgi:hypothetical protein